MAERFSMNRLKGFMLAAGVLAGAAGLSGNSSMAAVSAEEMDITIEDQGEIPEELIKYHMEPVIDFDSLKDTNSDVYAWLYYPGTGGIIDYPIMQSVGDQEFYLHHDWQGNESYPGSIFSQSYNRKSFTDFLTVLYGHNMKDASMFGSLRELEGSDIMWDYNTVYVFLPYVLLKYRIFAAYVNDNSHLLYHFDQDDKEGCRRYIETIGEKCEGLSTFDREVYETLTPDSHILTMSTCYRGDPEHRFLVQAVLDESGEAGEWIALQQEWEDIQEQAASDRAWNEVISGARRRRAALEKARKEKLAPSG